MAGTSVINPVAYYNELESKKALSLSLQGPLSPSAYRSAKASSATLPSSLVSLSAPSEQNNIKPIANTQDGPEPSFLISSPYTTQEHLLDLNTLNTSQSLLATALSHLQATTPQYATTPYIDAFNWPDVVSQLRELSSSRGYTWPAKEAYYIVVFRSRIPPTTSRLELGQLDARSHAEANQSGGLLKYWFGKPDADGRNLATCVWRSRSDVGPASSGEGHKEAARKTRVLYTEWKIERLKLWIGEGVNEWGIEEWAD